MNDTGPAVTEDELREALLAQLRHRLVLSKIETAQIERLSVALKRGLISVRQCLALDNDTEPQND